MQVLQLRGQAAAVLLASSLLRAAKASVRMPASKSGISEPTSTTCMQIAIQDLMLGVLLIPLSVFQTETLP